MFKGIESVVSRNLPFKDLKDKRIKYIFEWDLENPSVWILSVLSAWKGVQSVQIM